MAYLANQNVDDEKDKFNQQPEEETAATIQSTGSGGGATLGANTQSEGAFEGQGETFNQSADKSFNQEGATSGSGFVNVNRYLDQNEAQSKKHG